MAQSSEPLTAEVVLEEISSALEIMGQDGDSELGTFTLKRDNKVPRGYASLVIKTQGGGTFIVDVRKA